MSSGLARRMTIVDMTPDQQTIDALKAAHDDGQYIEPNYELLKMIRTELKFLWENFNPETLRFSEDYVIERNKIAEDHLEQLFFDKVAIGYYVMRFFHQDRHIIIHMDDDLLSLMKMLKTMRANCLGGISDITALKLLGTRTLSLTEFKRAIASKLNIEYGDTERVISRLAYRKRISLDEVPGANGHKTKTMVTRLEVPGTFDYEAKPK